MKYGTNTHETQLGVQVETHSSRTQPPAQPISPTMFITTCAIHAHRVGGCPQAVEQEAGFTILYSLCSASEDMTDKTDDAAVVQDQAGSVDTCDRAVLDSVVVSIDRFVVQTESSCSDTGHA